MQEIFRDLAHYVLHKPGLSACALIICALVSLKFLPMAVLVMSVLVLVLLEQKRRIASLTIAGAIVAVLLGALWIPGRPGLEVPVILLLSPITLPAAWLVRRAGALGPALFFITLLLSVMVISVAWLSGNAAQFWQHWLERAIQGVPGARIQGFEDDGTLAVMNGLVACLLGLVGFLALLLGCWMRALCSEKKSFQQDFLQLNLPYQGTLLLMLLLIAAGLWRVDVQRDLLVLMTLPYAFMGLAVLHVTVERAKWPWFLAVPPYMGIALFPEATMLLMAGLGLADGMLHWRQKLMTLEN